MNIRGVKNVRNATNILEYGSVNTKGVNDHRYERARSGAQRLVRKIRATAKRNAPMERFRGPLARIHHGPRAFIAREEGEEGLISGAFWMTDESQTFRSRRFCRTLYGSRESTSCGNKGDVIGTARQLLSRLEISASIPEKMHTTKRVEI